MLDKNELTNIMLQLERLKGKDSLMANENANKDSNIFNTERDLTAGISAKAYGLFMLPEKVAEAHLNGDIHYHDLDYHPYAPMSNCCLIDFNGMLNNGFKIGNAEVDSPNSIQTATAQMAQVIANVASSQYGGCSVDRMDELLAPFAKKNFLKHIDDANKWGISSMDKYAQEKTKKDIYDAIQGLEWK